MSNSSKGRRIGRIFLVALTTIAVVSTMFVGAASAQSRNVIVGTTGSDVLEGTDGPDRINARAGGVDIVRAGAGNDRIIGGRGFDRITGGAGADVFVYRQNSEVDVITDFGTGNDRLVIKRAEVNSIADLSSIAQVRTNQVIFNFGDGDILVVQGSDVTLDSFTTQSVRF